MEISRSTVAASIAVLGAGMLAGGICLAVHAFSLSELSGLACFATGVPMAFFGGLFFMGASIAFALLKTHQIEEKITVIGQDLTIRNVYDSIIDL